MVEPTKRRALGRGMDALLPTGPAGSSSDTFKARIEELHPNRFQPRSNFDEKTLNDLASSLREKGFLQPLLVRKRAGGGYEIVAGERRWRAAQRAGIFEVPVVIRDLSDKDAFEAALVENLQRDDLNPLEEARAFQRAIAEHNHTQDSIASFTGKDRSTIAILLRLLKLPKFILDRIASRELTEGHARALLVAGEPAIIERLARLAIANSWSVRETERRARQAVRDLPDKHRGRQTGAGPNTRDLEERLSRALGAKVTVADRKGRGHLSITFSSYDELDKIIRILLQE